MFNAFILLMTWKERHPMDEYGSHVFQRHKNNKTTEVKHNTSPFCSCGVWKDSQSSLSLNGDANIMFLAKMSTVAISTTQHGRLRGRDEEPLVSSYFKHKKLENARGLYIEEEILLCCSVRTLIS